MTSIEAHELLKAKYPKATFDMGDIDITTIHDGDGKEIRVIEVWSNPGCESNSHAYCTDWFSLDGDHIGHKCK